MTLKDMVLSATRRAREKKLKKKRDEIRTEARRQELVEARDQIRSEVRNTGQGMTRAETLRLAGLAAKSKPKKKSRSRSIRIRSKGQ